MQILLVEDNPGDARLLREALEEVRGNDFELVHVERFEEALRSLAEKSFDLILLDLSLPDRQGLDMIASIRGEAPGVPVVVLTGLDDEESSLKALRQGAQDYLVKGQVDGKLLARAMRYAIERKRAEEEIQRHLKHITALREINLAMTSTLDLRAVLNVLMEKIDVLLNSPSILVWLLDRGSGVWKRAACWNLDEEEWKGRKLKGLPPLVHEAIESKAPVVARNVQTDPRTLDAEFYRRHGMVSYLGVPLIAKGEVLGVAAFLTKEERELTEDEIEFLSTLAGQAAIAIQNAQLYEQTKKQAVELEKASKMQADFAAMIAHDLRSPLMSVMSVAVMMEDGLFGPVNEEQKKWLQKIEAGSHNLVDLVSDFLDLSKLEAGHIDLLREEIDLKQLIENALENYLLLSKDKNISLTCRIDPSLPRVHADPRRLGQVLSNLLSNAIKFTGEGGKIEVTACPEDQGGVKVQVMDTGVGIPAREIGSLFAKYRQTASGKNSQQKGTGLGLVICKMIVEAHGGRIWAEGEDGKGSTFSFILPLWANPHL